VAQCHDTRALSRDGDAHVLHELHGVALHAVRSADLSLSRGRARRRRSAAAASAALRAPRRTRRRRFAGARDATLIGALAGGRRRLQMLVPLAPPVRRSR
jgi:chemotaxis response regulator CheB